MGFVLSRHSSWALVVLAVACGGKRQGQSPVRVGAARAPVSAVSATESVSSGAAAPTAVPAATATATPAPAFPAPPVATASTLNSKPAKLGRVTRAFSVDRLGNAHAHRLFRGVATDGQRCLLTKELNVKNHYDNPYEKHVVEIPCAELEPLWKLVVRYDLAHFAPRSNDDHSSWTRYAPLGHVMLLNWHGKRHRAYWKGTLENMAQVHPAHIALMRLSAKYTTPTKSYGYPL